ncbi:MAG: hypothetical protein PHE54_04530 [Bacilli bacterium]|nr:hypothetical protein [Bacilli bacterium]
MLKYDLKDLSLSAIALRTLNSDENDKIRKIMEWEIKRRFRNTGIHYDDFLQRENVVAQRRGYNEDNYLFSQNVSMQQLMKIYFEYLCNYSTVHNYFNDVDIPDFLHNFFYFTRIC